MQHVSIKIDIKHQKLMKTMQLLLIAAYIDFKCLKYRYRYAINGCFCVIITVFACMFSEQQLDRG